MIGLFDSGAGGLTVLREVARWLPRANLVYFGDTARLPYGDKSPETVLRYARENARFLVERGVEAIVIACHTASAHALETLQEELHIPVIGVIEPTIQACIQRGSGRIGVIATPGTIASEAYEKAIKKALPEASVTSMACPLFVPLAEEKRWNDPITQAVANDYLGPLRGKIDTLVLGCTHYPLLAPAIQEVIGDKVQLVDSATTTAQELARLLPYPKGSGNRSYYVSDDPQRFKDLGSAFLKDEITEVQLH